MLKKELKLWRFCLVMSIANFLFFHWGFFLYVFENIDYTSFNGVLMIFSLVIAMFAANFFTYYLFLQLLRKVGKVLMALTFLISSVAVYFVNTYHVIVDESMIGNVLNTKYSEASSFFSIKFVLYLLIFGVLPCIYIFRAKLIFPKWKKFFITISLTLVGLGGLAFANAANWLWIDKNSKQLGGLAMPWSYSVNTALFYIHKNKKEEKEILLPKAKIMDNQKAVVVLVIGESARSQNFSLYGYPRNTNPLLSKIPNLHHYHATSCATYTTAGVKCILEHQNTGDLYEILPNYLYRNDVDVIWRTTNWGEPPVHVPQYLTASDLAKNCSGEDCNYDGVLLSGLKEQILASKKNKVLIILHTSTSHGPTYSKKYPSKFQAFAPVCNSVELGNCTHQELVNAYDNTIVYTDYILANVIKNLEELKDYQSSMIFVSDHGESLGENNLYMHGLPLSIAPKEQFDIPFIVWTSPNSKGFKPVDNISQSYVFHSVLNFLHIQSPIYNENLNIFK